MESPGSTTAQSEASGEDVSALTGSAAPAVQSPTPTATADTVVESPTEVAAPTAGPVTKTAVAASPQPASGYDPVARAHLLKLEQTGRLKEALGQAIQGQAALDSDGEPFYAIAVVRLNAKLGRYKAAISAAESSRAAKDDADARFWSGYSKLLLGQAADALDDFRVAASLSPAEARVRLYTGLALQEKGRHSDAIEAFHQARELAPDLPEISYNTGVSWWMLGERNRARAAFLHFMAASESNAARYSVQRERVSAQFLR